MTPEEEERPAELPGPAATEPEPSADDEPPRTEAEPALSEVLEAIGGAARTPGSFVFAPYGNINAGSVRGGQRVHNGAVNGGRRPREGRVREGPVPETEVQAAAFGFAKPDWFPEALAKLEQGPLFLTGRPGSGRRTAALNLLRESCGEKARLRALDSVIELDRWQPTDKSARGYLMDGLFPSRPLSPGVLGHVRLLLEKNKARMVIVLPDDAALLRRLEQDLHISPVMCLPPPPSTVFGAYFEATVPQQWERERLLSALDQRHELGDLLVPELVPAEVVELVTAIVTADGDPDRLGDLGDRLSYRAEREVPELIAKLRGEPDILAFLLAVCVYEGWDQRLVREEADRLSKVAESRLTAVLPGTDAQGAEKAERPNPDFVFRRSLTELLHAVRAVAKEPEIRTEGSYAHSVQAVAFVRHRQAEVVLRHVWREYGQLSDLMVEWLREVPRSSARPVGQFMGRAASWGGGQRALRHIKALAESERAASRLIAANALSIAAEDPVLVAEVRYRLRRWSWAVDYRLRTTVAYTCGAEFGLSRPDLALELLDSLLLGAQGGHGEKMKADDSSVLLSVRAAITSLFQAGNETKVFDQLVKWLSEEKIDPEQSLLLFGELLRASPWLMQKLADETPEAALIIEIIRYALNTESVFEVTCAELLRWSEWGQWEEVRFRAVEKLFSALARSMRSGEFRLFVELDEKGADGWAGLEIARASLRRWRAGEQREAA